MSELTEETATRRRELRQRSDDHIRERKPEPTATPARPWVASLHATTGNRGVSRLLAGPDPLRGMRISPSLGGAEVSRMLLRLGDDAALEEEEELQAKHTDAAIAQREGMAPEDEEELVAAKHESPGVLGAEGGELDAAAAGRIESLRGGGSSLSPDIQAKMEGHFGTDLSSVRVHQDSEADALAAGMSARAFTTGSDVFLRQSERAGDTTLMAHELAHVVQQTSGEASGAQGAGTSVGAANDPLEAEADREAALLNAGAASRLADETDGHS